MSAESAEYTAKQGQYLAFIHYYAKVNGRPPAQADIQRYFDVSPPTVHQMIKRLDEKGLISRKPGEPRAIEVLVPVDALPELK